MDITKSTLADLIKYISIKCSVDPEKINRETSLLNDLELKGDDVDNLFADIVRDFKVDVKKLDLSRFCKGDEPFDFMSPVVRFFKAEKVSEKPTIKIVDIERFIQTGILE